MSRHSAKLALKRISGGALLLAFMACAAIPAALLSHFLLGRAAEATGHRMEALGSSLLRTLEASGLPELRRRVGLLDEAALFGEDRVAVAVWRLREGGRQVVAETGEATVALEALQPGEIAMIDGPWGRMRAEALDVAARSGGWALPFSDVAIVVAAPALGRELRSARETVAAIWGGFAMALLVGMLLHLNHRARFSAGVEAMTARLDEFADGRMDVRMPVDPPAPELAPLSLRMNPILDRLKEHVDDLRLLSVNAAHEMRTPLALVKIRLSTLAASAGEAAPQIAEAEAEIDRALGVFEAIMGLFRLDAERDRPVDGAPVDLTAIVTDAVDDMEAAIETGGRQLETQIQPGLVVPGDAGLLARLIANLLENAAKYAPREATVRVALQASRDRFRLSVSNDGGGFPMDVRDRAFERFARSNSVRRRPGVGIGLNLVRTIAERHGFSASVTPSDDVAEVVIEGPCLAIPPETLVSDSA